MMKDAYVHRGELHADAAIYLDAAYADFVAGCLATHAGGAPSGTGPERGWDGVDEGLGAASVPGSVTATTAEP